MKVGITMVAVGTYVNYYTRRRADLAKKKFQTKAKVALLSILREGQLTL